jgi:hypothetical protein
MAVVRRVLLGALVSVLVAACGGDATPPAAVVGAQEITLERLNTELNLLLAETRYAELVEGPNAADARREITRELLTFLIQEEVFLEYARANDIDIQPNEIEQQLDAEVARAGGQEAFVAELEAQGLTLATARRNIERNILLDKVETAVLEERGVSAEQQPVQAQAALQQWYRDRLRALNVRVDPSFGRFDPESGLIVAPGSPTP